MFWVRADSITPQNGAKCLVSTVRTPKDYVAARYFDTGFLLPDGNTAQESGYYVRSRAGNWRLLRAAIEFVLILDAPEDPRETRAKHWNRGYRAALLRVLSILEARAEAAVPGEAWTIQELHAKIEQEFAKDGIKRPQ